MWRNSADLPMDGHSEVAGDIPASSEDGFPAEELFAAAKTAVILAEEATGRVVAVNPAAHVLLGVPRSDLVGCDWHKAFSRTCVQQLRAAARQAASSGAAVQAAATGPTGGAAVTVTFSTFHVAEVCYLLVRLAGDDAAESASRTISRDVFQELDHITVGFVITDGALCVEFANKAFLELVDQPSSADVEGRCLLRWLNLTQADLSGMRRQMELHVADTEMITTLCIGSASGPMVEVTAIAVPDATRAHWGFVVHRVVPH
jgi:PAS domain-containing protein